MRVLVTGGAGGIGKAVSEQLLKEGYDVIIHYNKSEGTAKELCSRFPNAYMLKADLSCVQEIKDMFKAVDALGGADALINNAGISLISCFQDVSEQEYERLCAVNFKSVYFCSKYAVEHMIKKKSGNIVNISSIWGITGASCEALYSALKAGVIAFSKSLARELAPSGIRVNCVAPGIIDTPMNSSLDENTIKELKDETPLARLGKPEDIANAVSFLLSERSSFITGQVLTVDGGFLKL